ncbi:hypothetical protein FOXYSP1_19043 [Fusarium oxysporum f. sp. phaseoli]
MILELRTLIRNLPLSLNTNDPGEQCSAWQPSNPSNFGPSLSAQPLAYLIPKIPGRCAWLEPFKTPTIPAHPARPPRSPLVVMIPETRVPPLRQATPQPEALDPDPPPTPPGGPRVPPPQPKPPPSPPHTILDCEICVIGGEERREGNVVDE